MASSEVDQKFLGRLATAVEHENPILSNVLFKILGLSLNLAKQLLLAKRMRPRSRRRQPRPSHSSHNGAELDPVFDLGLDPADVSTDAYANADINTNAEAGSNLVLDPVRVRQFLDLAYHVLWLSREGLNLLEQYVLPLVGHNAELIVLAFKLRASFLHIFALFYNQPPVSRMSACDPDILAAAYGLRRPSVRRQTHSQQAVRAQSGLAVQVQSSPSPASFQQRKRRGDKGKRSLALYDEDVGSTMSSLQPTHLLEGGAAQPRSRSRSRSHSYSHSYSPSPSPISSHFHSSPPATLKSFVVPRIISQSDYVPTAHDYFKTAVQLSNQLLCGSHSLRLSVKTEYVAFLYECVHDPEASRRLAREAITEVYEAQEGMDDDMFEDACQLVAALGRMKKRGQPQTQPQTQPQPQTQTQTHKQAQPQTQTHKQAQPQPQTQTHKEAQPQPQPQKQKLIQTQTWEQYQPHPQSHLQLQPQHHIQTQTETQAQAPGQRPRHRRETNIAATSPGHKIYSSGYGSGYEIGYDSPSRSELVDTPSSVPPPGMENPI